jgi:hypothetical protein
MRGYIICNLTMHLFSGMQLGTGEVGAEQFGLVRRRFFILLCETPTGFDEH